MKYIEYIKANFEGLLITALAGIGISTVSFYLMDFVMYLVRLSI